MTNQDSFFTDIDLSFTKVRDGIIDIDVGFAGIDPPKGGVINPVISAASVAGDGDTWSIRFNKAVSQGAGWSTLDMTANGSTAGAVALTYVSGSGTKYWTFTGGTTIVAGETLTISWAGTANGIEDTEGTDVPAVANLPATNNVPADLGSLTWANFNSELIRAANENGHNNSDPEFNAFVDYIFFDAAAFNLADGNALDTALTNETLSIANLDTYAAAYTP